MGQKKTTKFIKTATPPKKKTPPQKKKKKKKKEDKILPSGLSFPDRIPNNFLPSGLQN
jgi:hypothetical protein